MEEALPPPNSLDKNVNNLRDQKKKKKKMDRIIPDNWELGDEAGIESTQAMVITTVKEPVQSSGKK